MHLIEHQYDLFVYLRKNPKLINDQDENGKTILHHSVPHIIQLGAKRLFEFLLEVPEIDFNIKDSQGNAAVHEFGLHGSGESKYFQEILKKAILSGFDCSLKGQNGLTILHIASNCRYVDSITHRNENLPKILKILIDSKISNLEAILNTLCDKGYTALWLALSDCSYAEAIELLDAGADPLIHCAEEIKSPLEIIADRKKYCIKWHEEATDRYDKKSSFDELQTILGVEKSMTKNPELPLRK